MKKILTIVGTRPELIRLSETIKLLDIHTNHIFVHTGQNFTPELHNQFFHDLDLRLPNYQFNQEGKSGIPYIGDMLQNIDHVIDIEKPDAVLLLGDTNSALSAYVAKRRKLPIFHMEAGNRCYDDNVPEETNRKIIDSLSAYLLPYTQRSRENLLTEGYHPSKIIVIGNPIVEVLKVQHKAIEKRQIQEEYILVTLHRDENVTNKIVLQNIISALEELSKTYKIIFSVHPKLEEMISKFDIKVDKSIQLSKPFGLKEFLNLEKYAKCVLSDSGTVPEECCIFGTPCVLLRTSTERPELLENNSMILSGVSTVEILNSTQVAMNTSVGRIPDEYRDSDTSQKILKLLLRHI